MAPDIDQVSFVTAQLSAVTGLEIVNVELQLLGLLLVIIFAGQVIIGFWLSVTVTVMVQEAERPWVSVTVQTIVVGPPGNWAPARVLVLLKSLIKVAPGSSSEKVALNSVPWTT